MLVQESADQRLFKSLNTTSQLYIERNINLNVFFKKRIKPHEPEKIHFYQAEPTSNNTHKRKMANFQH